MPGSRLSDSASTYLRQHAADPVDWRPWGDEAFAEAARRDVPVLLSCGYAACHWCHVMQRESFRDPETAALLNERFVPVKVGPACAFGGLDGDRERDAARPGDR